MFPTRIIKGTAFVVVDNGNEIDIVVTSPGGTQGILVTGSTGKGSPGAADDRSENGYRIEGVSRRNGYAEGVRLSWPAKKDGGLKNSRHSLAMRSVADGIDLQKIIRAANGVLCRGTLRLSAHRQSNRET